MKIKQKISNFKIFVEENHYNCSFKVTDINFFVKNIETIIDSLKNYDKAHNMNSGLKSLEIIENEIILKTKNLPDDKILKHFFKNILELKGEFRSDELNSVMEQVKEEKKKLPDIHLTNNFNILHNR